MKQFLLSIVMLVNSLLCSIPDLPSDVKHYTDYRCYNIVGTAQYNLQQQATTDELGFRRYGDDYIVAMGSYYSTEVGDRFYIHQTNNISYTVVTGDMKADIHTDPTNRYLPCINYDNEECANILEFIIDERVMDNRCLSYGSVSYYDDFDADIDIIMYLGRI